MRGPELAEGADEGGIDFDGAAAEELGDAVGDGGVEGSAEQRVGGGVGAGLLLLGVRDLRFFLGFAEGEQAEDVGLGGGAARSGRWA